VGLTATIRSLCDKFVLAFGPAGPISGR
jgi:hypothetical protein